MSKLKEMVNKGVRLIVAESEDPSQPSSPEVVTIPPEAMRTPEPRPLQSELPMEVTDFSNVYNEAGLQLPLHGYGVDKVGEMLESKRLASLGPEVKATAVMAALEAAGVSIKDVIQDAVARDKVMDAFEAGKEQEVKQLRDQSETRVQAIKDEIENFLREKNSEIEGLKKAADAAAQAFTQLQIRKRKEEDRLYQVVAYFIEGAENPITTVKNPAPTLGQRPGRL